MIKFLYCYSFVSFEDGTFKIEDPHIINTVYMFQKLLW